MNEKKPWLKFYGDVPHSIVYPDKTMYEMVLDAALLFPENTAYNFMGTRSTYKKLLTEIDHTADTLLLCGLKKADTVTISLPNCPQAVILFYALNKIGAVASMIHPLSAPSEIEFYLKESRSVWAVTLDAFYENFSRILDKTNVKTLLLTKISDYLSPVKSITFFLISLPVGYFIFGVKPAPYNKRANKNFVSLADFNNKFRIIDTQTIQNPLYFLKYWAYFIKLCARDTQHSSKFTFR